MGLRVFFRISVVYVTQNISVTKDYTRTKKRCYNSGLMISQLKRYQFNNIAPFALYHSSLFTDIMATFHNTVIIISQNFTL